MTRTETLARLLERTEHLSNEQLDALLDLTAALARPSVYASLPAPERASIEQGLADLDAGRVVDADEVFTAIDRRIERAVGR